MFEVLADDLVRRILVTVNDEPQSAKDISQACDVSHSAIYRRLSVLTEYELLTEASRINPRGHHYSVYEPNFGSIRISLEDSRIVLYLQSEDADGRSSEGMLGRATDAPSQ